VTQQQARGIFNRVDVNGEGCLSIEDLIPVVFGKASKEVQKMIVTYIEAEVSKRKIVGKDFLKEIDLENLFEHYDENVVGFIPVALLRDKVKSMQLPEAANYEVLLSMKEMEDDEMVNKGEFVRIFRLYLL
jgi:Ca2+-binding EF-hand superfamily protein